MAEVALKLLDGESKFNPTLAIKLFTNSLKIASQIQMFVKCLKTGVLKISRLHENKISKSVHQEECHLQVLFPTLLYFYWYLKKHKIILCVWTFPKENVG